LLKTCTKNVVLAAFEDSLGVESAGRGAECVNVLHRFVLGQHFFEGDIITCHTWSRGQLASAVVAHARVTVFVQFFSVSNNFAITASAGLLFTNAVGDRLRP
jgi:hypothetical protein